MIKTISVNLVAMRDYFAVTAQARQYIVPSVPAVYVWTLDLSRLGRLQASEARSEVDRILNSPRRLFLGRLEPYYSISVADTPRALSETKSSKIELIAGEGGQPIDWILLSATLFQRPLYVGQTRDLNQRVQNHVRPGSKLRSYLEEGEVGIEDCSVAYVEAPFDATLNQTGEGAVEEEEEEFESSAAPTLAVTEALLQRLMRPFFGKVE